VRNTDAMSKLKLPEVEKAFVKYNKNIIKLARATLVEENLNVTKAMSESLGYEFKAFPNSIQNNFVGNKYADFQDKGVRGNTSTERAPNSPYSFKPATTMVPFQPILEWVTARRYQFRNRDTGQFMSYKSTAFLIAHSIPRKGLHARRFLSKHVLDNVDKLTEQLQTAFSIDFGRILLDDKIRVDDMP
jgi:hypothetical protein